jgi:hypothetical protein
MDEISSRETVEVGRWDQSLEELREDPEVEEAIVAIDSDPPPGPFVRSTPPGARAIDEALMREQEPHRDAVIDYHEPPDVDPPPLQYEHVFGVETSDARIRAPRAVQPGSIDPASSRKPSKARWPVFVLVLGCAAAAIAYWTMPQPVTVPASAPAPAPVMAPAPVTAPASVPVTAPASEEATVTAPAPVTVPAPAAGPDSATAEGEAPIPNPNAIFPETGALDTYDAQLALARRLKRGSRAAAAYRRAIELNPASSPALAELARLMLARNHTREAAELAERATALDPTNALAWVALGAARQARGDRQGARQAYQNCAKLGKGHYVSECRAMLR